MYTFCCRILNEIDYGDPPSFWVSAGATGQTTADLGAKTTDIHFLTLVEAGKVKGPTRLAFILRLLFWLMGSCCLAADPHDLSLHGWEERQKEPSGISS